MLSISVLFTLFALVWSEGSTPASLDDGSGIFQVEIRTNNIGRIKYEDGEVIFSQNQRKQTDIFFTPFPRVDPASTECRENLLSDHTELVLSVKLYTPEIIDEINAYLQQRHSTLCSKDQPCDVSLIPMNAIRLVQKGLRTTKAREMYTVNDEWYSNTLLLQSVEFIIYTANGSVCEKLRTSIAGQCHLSNFEAQYSLHSERTVERQVEITTEQVTGTSMFDQIRSQFPKSDTVAMTTEDFKQLVSDVMDKITMKIRIQEGFDSQVQDPINLDRLLERQLQIKQIHLDKSNDQLWESLYWTSDLTRPDRLATALSTIIRKNSTDGSHFVYDRQAAKNLPKLGLTQYDSDRFEQHDKTRLNNTQYVLSRAEVEKYLTELSPHVHLDGNFIVPKPLDLSLIKLSKLKTETKLLSHAVLVRTRRDIHTLPLRCPSKRSNKTMVQPANQLSLLKDKVDALIREQKQFADRLTSQAQLENRIASVESKALKSRMRCETGNVDLGYCKAFSCPGRRETRTVTFEQPFGRAPAFVHLALSGLDSYHERNTRLIIRAQDITSHGFNAVFRSWDNTIIYSADANWIACA